MLTAGRGCDAPRRRSPCSVLLLHVSPQCSLLAHRRRSARRVERPLLCRTYPRHPTLASVRNQRLSAAAAASLIRQKMPQGGHCRAAPAFRWNASLGPAPRNVRIASQWRRFSVAPNRPILSKRATVANTPSRDAHIDSLVCGWGVRPPATRADRDSPLPETSERAILAWQRLGIRECRLRERFGGRRTGRLKRAVDGVEQSHAPMDGRPF
jgi:hypothetical protein